MRKGKWAVVLCAAALLLALTAVPAASAKKADPTEAQIRAIMGQMNAQLEARGENIRLAVVETLTAGEQQGITVYFNDRAKQMGSHWVPGDPRRFGSNDIYWASDQIEGFSDDVVLADTQAAIGRAMTTWDSLLCSVVPLIHVDDYGLDLGYVQWLLGFGGIPGWLADISHAGWLDGSFFDAIAPPNGATYILGATFTFVWTSGGIPTDLDNNKKTDVAFREVYYNNNFPWAIDANYDVETIVLHETGHCLSVDHFGKLFQTDANGKFHFAPRAVMNAGYTGVQQVLAATDISSFCSIWAAWPNK